MLTVLYLCSLSMSSSLIPSLSTYTQLVRWSKQISLGTSGIRNSSLQISGGRFFKRSNVSYMLQNTV